MNKPFVLFAIGMTILFPAVPSLALVGTATGMNVSDMTCGDIKALDRDQMSGEDVWRWTL